MLVRYASWSFESLTVPPRHRNVRCNQAFAVLRLRSFVCFRDQTTNKQTSDLLAGWTRNIYLPFSWTMSLHIKFRKKKPRVPMHKCGEQHRNSAAEPHKVFGALPWQSFLKTHHENLTSGVDKWVRYINSLFRLGIVNKTVMRWISGPCSNT